MVLRVMFGGWYGRCCHVSSSITNSILRGLKGVRGMVMFVLPLEVWLGLGANCSMMLPV